MLHYFTFGKLLTLLYNDCKFAQYFHNNQTTRDFTFSGSSWKLTYTMYADSCKLFPLFAFDTEGSFIVGKKSKIVANAFDADFSFVKKHLTVLTADPSVVQMFGFTSCNLKHGVKTDISESGWSFLPSVKNYNSEYDLLSLNNGILQFGYRPADNNMGKPEFRPKALGYPLEIYSSAKHTNNVDPNGTYALTAPGATTQVAITKYNKHGELLWAFHVGGTTTSEAPHGIGCDINNNICVTGYFGSTTLTGPQTASFNPLSGGNVSTQGNEDCFVAKCFVHDETATPRSTIRYF